MAYAMANQLRSVDPSIWKACAGNSVEIPNVDSRVYYFPQGHAEQSKSPPEFSSLVYAQPYVHCRILSVRFLANSDTDEVFAMIRLEAIDRYHSFGVHCMSPAAPVASKGDLEERKIVSFVKILTPSDANNGGGFSVPRFCADSIFPPLDYKEEPPVQSISVRDVHGMVWEFRHIYRGTPRRHLLTTGWSKFVNYKKLVAGDSVVFMKNPNGELFVGIRRTARGSGSVDSVGWNCQYASGASAMVKLEEEFRNREGFSRTERGKVPSESVVEAAELARAGRPFEIVYYPRAGSPDFVVKAETVDESLNIIWTAGMRVKMAVETEDSSRMTWFQGTVSSAAFIDTGPWHASPWRMLQVTWDEPEVLQNVKKVSPWQVELIATTPPLQTPFPPTKKLRVSQNPDFLTPTEGGLYFPMAGLTNSMMGNLSQPLFGYNSLPVSMQGARQDSYYVSSLSNFVSNNSRQMGYDNLYGNVAPKSSCVSTELNIGSASQSDNSSPNSQSSVHFFGTELLVNRNRNTTTKSGVCSFQLFGQIIQTNQPVESGSDDVGCSEDDGSKGYKEIEGINNLLDPSPSCSYNNLYNGVDVPCQRGSAVEACSL
ncbi:auxin response factor 17-like [Macadamia integrifolia]|uniref:auxin response factor 17-like n=1 Tax=Macadamia integrifolia TaxID=60698 RepID=UPI001C4F8753|nr:auxin response factor 17-like [Macadamia integrifolia]XP_042506898.1 auxin response factor 17-like [Macadamia integrifolia]